MNPGDKKTSATSVTGKDASGHTQLLLLADGRVLAHNLTPAIAEILQLLDPEDRLIRKRSLLLGACAKDGPR
jgi:hypothetical protein